MVSPLYRGVLLFGLVMMLADIAQGQTCTPVNHSFTDSFSNTTYKDDASTAKWGNGEVTLATKGSLFQSEGKSLGQRVYVIAPGDFDKDGWIDMFALMLDPDCHLHFLRNNGVIDGVHQGFSLGGTIGSIGFDNYRIDSPVGCSTESPVLISGDYDGDGDTDVLYMRVTGESNAGNLAYAVLYRNDGVIAGLAQFTPVDIFPTLNAYGLSWHWTSTVAQAIDWDKDGLSDFVIASSTGTTNKVLLFKANTNGVIGFQAPITLITNIGLYTPIATASSAASGNSSCPPAVSRGANALMTGDFDQDGDNDIIVGSTSQKDLVYWRNSGNDVFYRVSDIPFSQGGVTLGMVGDLDGDSDLDIAVGRDGWNCNGVGGTLWVYRNDGTGTFVQRSVPVANAGDDLDFGAAFQVDNDPDNRLDMIVADGNNSGTYNQALSGQSNVYVLSSTAVSKPIDIVSGNTDTIVSITFNTVNLTNATPPGNTATFYVSNDDGLDWEPLTANELPPLSNPHNFVHFGSNLRWKAVFTTQEETLLPEDQVLAPGSTDTPHLLDMTVSYSNVDRRRYSRSGLAIGTVTIAGTKHQVIYSSSFYFPGYQSTLTGFDTTTLGVASVSNTSLEHIDTNPSVSVLFDAGEILANRSSNSRVIYTSYAKTTDNDNVMNDRLNLSLSELAAPSSNPTLQSMMGLLDSEKTAFYNFFTGARGDVTGWKLYHIGHSTPAFVGAPTGDATYLGSNYDQFKTAQANRAPTVYIGANDGMLHAFDAITGEERWAFVPHNLLAKLKSQRTVDAQGVEHYLPGFFIDGPLVVQDAYDGTAWRTILISGQGLGKGLMSQNYYFALDITDPLNPLPLWEFSDPQVIRQACSGNPCSTTCVQVCQPPVCSDGCLASNASRLFLESNGVVSMEAEDFSTNNTTNNIHTWATTTDAAASGGEYMLSTPNNGTSCVSNKLNKCGAHMTYHFRTTTGGTYYPFFLLNAANTNDNIIDWGLAGVFSQEVTIATADSTWQWTAGSSINLAAGDLVFDIWMRKDGMKIDKIVLSKTNSVPTGLGPAEVCQDICAPPVCGPSCTTTCIPAGQPWPECGVGANLQCCGYTDGTNLCTPLTESCGQDPDAAMGETWSAPAFARVKIGTATKWVAFFGSGYNNLSQSNVGRAIYSVDVLTGTLLGRWDTGEIANSPTNPSTIDNTTPGAPSVLDVDNDGIVDRVYAGDLEGRLWKIEVSTPGVVDAQGLLDHSQWPSCLLFDAGQPTGSGNRTWAPIITKPGLALLNGRNPNVFFGTGGDDRAPQTVQYRFYSVRDNDLPGACLSTPLRLADLSISEGEWVVGDGKLNTPDPLTAAALPAPGTQEGLVGEHYWSDPLVTGDSIFFASLPGSIDHINPCLNLGDSSKFFGYAIAQHKTAAGVVIQPGTSLFGSAWLTTTSKIRQAPMLRTEAVDTTPWARYAPVRSAAVSDIIVQEFTGESPSGNPSISRVADPGKQMSNNVRIMRWRELPL
jgi:hypothetical protein